MTEMLDGFDLSPTRGDEFDDEIGEIFLWLSFLGAFAARGYPPPEIRRSAQERRKKDLQRLVDIGRIRKARGAVAGAVSCDEHCGALEEPGDDVEHLKKTLEHYKNHGGALC